MNNQHKRFNISSFRGLPVNTNNGYMSNSYLTSVYRTIMAALSSHPRTLAIRVDLSFPKGALMGGVEINGAISRFIENLKYRIKKYNGSVMPCGRIKHHSDVRYIWVREQSTSDLPHFHVVLLLNGDSFNTLGSFTSYSDNLFHRIREAWNSALGFGCRSNENYIHVPENPCYRVNQEQGLSELFYRVSYLCKVRTKHFSKHYDSFGCSRS